MPDQVVTRFAPSPTGYLHIGGARTALFNWLYARGRGGKFLLRIEDTDRARSTPEATAAILQGLTWLGLDWDGEPVSQAAGAARHAEVAHQLLSQGKAYKCFSTQDEIAAFREAAKAGGRSTQFRSPWRDADPSTHPDAPYAIRIRAPQDGTTVIRDRVQGDVTIRNDQLDDMIILRSDATPVYMLAVVVDDHDMGVSHVIRGDDHLNNAFRQLPIIRAMDVIEGGWPDPVYAHIPLIHGADGAKLSKRHGALGVEAYRDEMGVLPEALFNYLLRLGWGYGDEDVISRDRAIELFDIAGIGKSPSRFDLAKLQNLNGIYLREADDVRLASLVAERMDGTPDIDLLAQAMPVLKVRAKGIDEIAEGAAFLFVRHPLEMSAKAQALLDEEACERLALVHERLSKQDVWTIETLEGTVKGLAEDLGLGLGKLAQPMRAALTGQTTSPGIFDVLVLLGRDESLARIGAQARASAGSQ